MTAQAGTVAPRMAALAEPVPARRPGGLSGWVGGLRGWRRWGAAWIAGALGAAAMPPYGFLPALAVSLCVAVWLTDGAVADRSPGHRALPAFLIGWAWGFGYLTAGLWWLGSAFLVEADEFLWALPLGVIGLPFALGLFYGAGVSVAGVLWSRGPARIAALAFGLAGAEWLRGHILTGFPWNTLGMALGQNLWLMQAAAFVGLYGLTVLAVLLCAAPATIWDRASRPARWGSAAAAALVLAGLAGVGADRLTAGDSTVPGVRLRLVQPDLPQDAKFRPENRDGIVERYIALSEQAPAPGSAAPTHIVWPESAFPFLIQRDNEARARIAASLQGKRILITGAARADEPLPGERPRIYNAVMVIEPDGTITDAYDKVHLVPFGEYLPGVLDGLLRAVGLRQFVAIPGGFSAGSPAGQRMLTVPGLPPVVATICYEAIFPGAIRPAGEPADANKPPGLILNVTNDGWFGDTPGPRQHLAQARLRAVEEGLPLVRDANTGISAVIDPHGRIVARTPIGVETVLDSDLPTPLPGATVYSRLGDWLFALMLLGCLGGALIGRRVA